MRTVVIVTLGLVLSGLWASRNAMALEDSGVRQQALADGILRSAQNARVTRVGDELQVTPADTRQPIEIDFAACQALGIQNEAHQWWVLPISNTETHITANRALWVLPVDATAKDHAWHLVLHGGSLTAETAAAGLKVTIHAESATLTTAEARPHSDPFGHRFSLEFPGGTELGDALAAYYWGTMLPSVVERTMAARFRYSDGYVLSTLNTRSYAGSYPAVDHEFQIKGRLAIGSDLDLDIVRRMIELQFRLIHDDPEHLHRAPTSVQPDGRREYHVRRDSLDRRENAAMFPVTGNVEVIEEAWRYDETRKDGPWLAANISNLEDAAGWILANTDPYGRVWSDVYYEDQVIKDGRVTQAQAFAAHAFSLLAEMEKRLGRPTQSTRYDTASKKMASVLVAPLPDGYWDAHKNRFVDWVDRNGLPHDHLHLLANELPVAFGYATPDQATAVRHLVDENSTEFERFPSFVASEIGAYDKSEIGIAGPYDLCAAGRYWYWDAAYRESQSQNQVLLEQLHAVATEGAKHGYFMDERYDMDHVYYIDGKDSHGAEKYYEYPNVFAAVLIDKFLGLSPSASSDMRVAPHLTSYGTVKLAMPHYALEYKYGEREFTLKNLSGAPRRFEVDLSALRYSARRYRLSSMARHGIVGAHATITLLPKGEARWIPEL
jgi:hypothetical protein